MDPGSPPSPAALSSPYVVRHADGSPVDADAVFVVLRLDGGPDLPHVRACRSAARQYAREAPAHHAAFATELRDLLDRYDREGFAAIVRRGCWSEPAESGLVGRSYPVREFVNGDIEVYLPCPRVDGYWSPIPTSWVPGVRWNTVASSYG